jgi:hypothetical protein
VTAQRRRAARLGAVRTSTTSRRRPRWRMIPPGPPYGTISGVPTLRITQDDAADEMLSRDPLALLLGMLFDQHMCGRSSGA